MNFVKHTEINGKQVKQIPCIVGSGAPTTLTEGAVGSLYMDEDNSKLYKCTAVTDGLYIWESLNSITVTVTDDVASHTSAEIYAHVQADGAVILLHEGTYYVLGNCDSDSAIFIGFSDGNGFDTIVWKIDDTGLAEHLEYSHVITPTTAKVGQTIVVKQVDANGKPTAWECVDLPSGGGSGITVAKFSTQDLTVLYCSSHTHDVLQQTLVEGYPVIAHIAIEDQQGRQIDYVTVNCWVNTAGYVCVGDYFNDSGWIYSGSGTLWYEL